jgi:hypothetical protein
MSQKIILASFANEGDLLGAVRGVRERSWHIVDLYTPYAVHGLEELLGWRRSRLPAACLLGGAAGLGLALWFQYWTTAQDWPLNVGGRPWNSLPAFVPVAFECMVLLAGFGLVFAWLFRCRLYPGKSAVMPLAGLTDNRFALMVRVTEAPADFEAVRQLFNDCHAVAVEERDKGEPHI